MTLPRHHNPVHLLAGLVGLVLLVAAAVNPAVFRLSVPSVTADFDENATNVLGPAAFNNEAPWQLVFFPTDPILEMADDDTDGVIWAVAANTIYYCTLSSLCDEEGDWTSYAMTSSLRSIAIDSDIQVLWVGTSGATGEILRCDIVATGCDDETDWTSAFSTTLYASNSIEAIGEASDFLFASVNGGFSSGPTTVYRCDIGATACDDTGDWTEANPSHGGVGWQYLYDENNDDLYLGHRDSSGSGYIQQCIDLAVSGCDDSGDWASIDGAGTFFSFAWDATNGVIYAGLGTDVEGDPREGFLRCDTATGCDEDSDWLVIGAEGGPEMTSLAWEDVNGSVFAGEGSNLYRCDTDTLCDEIEDFELVSTEAGQTVFIVDDVNSVIHSAGSVAYRCELSTGCGAATELSVPTSVAYDTAGGRLFVSDSAHHRILIYDLSDGLTDGEDPANVLGQADFSGEECNRGGGMDANTLCLETSGEGETDYFGGLAYDSIGNRLFVADSFNNRVLVYDAGAIADGASAAFVLGPDSFTSTFPTELSEPSDLAYDETNARLFVANLLDSSVLIYDLSGGITNGMDPAFTLGDYSWTTDFNSGESGTYSFVSDTTNGVLYAGTGTGGIIFRCLTSTACDEDADWSTAADTSEIIVWELAFDAGNGVLYGGATSGIIYRCDTSTDCDSTGEWTVASDSAEFNIHALAYDPTDGTMYAGTSAGGHILRCDTATDCDADADWTTAIDTASTQIADLVVDTADGVLYGAGTGGLIHRCVLSSGCESAGDWTSMDTGSATMLSFAYDSANGALYVGDDLGTITKCETATGCDDAGEWVTSFPSGVDSIYEMAFDSVHAVLYASTFISSPIYRCDTATGCDDSSDWTTSYSAGQSLAMHFDPATEAMYSGDGSGTVFRCDTATGCASTPFEGPIGVAYDSDGNRLFLSEENNHRVLVFDATTVEDNESPVNVLGQPDFNTTGANTSQSGLSTPLGIGYRDGDGLLYVAERDNHRVLVFNVGDGITDGEVAVEVYGQPDFDTGCCGGSEQNRFSNPGDATPVGDELFVADTGNNRIMIFGVAAPPPSGGGSNPAPPTIGFTPLRIEVNDEQVETDSRNVLVKVFATSTDTFTGTVDILLSNDPRFATFIPFRYVIPERRGNQTTRDIWPKTMAWDLCFGLEDPDDCDPGRKIVYARFYVNVPAPTPQLMPTPETAVEHPDPTP